MNKRYKMTRYKYWEKFENHKNKYNLGYAYNETVINNNFKLSIYDKGKYVYQFDRKKYLGFCERKEMTWKRFVTMLVFEKYELTKTKKPKRYITKSYKLYMKYKKKKNIYKRVR